MAVCEKNTTIGTSCQGAMLPSITNVINLADSHDRAAFAMVTHVKQEPRERENSESKEEVTCRKHSRKIMFLMKASLLGFSLNKFGESALKMTLELVLYTLCVMCCILTVHGFLRTCIHSFSPFFSTVH